MVTRNMVVSLPLGATAKELQRWGRWVACWLELHRKQRDLKLLAYQDELSGAWNRRFLKTCFNRELQIARDTQKTAYCHDF